MGSESPRRSDSAFEFDDQTIAQRRVSYLLEADDERAAPTPVRFIEGEPQEPLSIGTTGTWRVTGPGVLPVHAFVHFDGRSVFVCSTDAANPVMVDGMALPRRWTELVAPCSLRIGGIGLRFGCEAIAATAETSVARPPPQMSPHSAMFFDQDDVTRAEVRPEATPPMVRPNERLVNRPVDLDGTATTYRPNPTLRSFTPPLAVRPMSPPAGTPAYRLPPLPPRSSSGARAPSPGRTPLPPRSRLMADDDERTAMLERPDADSAYGAPGPVPTLPSSQGLGLPTTDPNPTRMGEPLGYPSSQKKASTAPPAFPQTANPQTLYSQSASPQSASPQTPYPSTPYSQAPYSQTEAPMSPAYPAPDPDPTRIGEPLGYGQAPFKPPTVPPGSGAVPSVVVVPPGGVPVGSPMRLPYDDTVAPHTVLPSSEDAARETVLQPPMPPRPPEGVTAPSLVTAQGARRKPIAYVVPAAVLLVTVIVIVVVRGRLSGGTAVHTAPTPTETAAPNNTASVPAAADDLPEGVVVHPAPAPAEPATSAKPRAKEDAGASLERQAVDAVNSGDLRRAATLYDQLATKHPEQPAFAQSAQILRARLDGGR